MIKTMAAKMATTSHAIGDIVALNDISISYKAGDGSIGKTVLTETHTGIHVAIVRLLSSRVRMRLG